MDSSQIDSLVKSISKVQFFSEQILNYLFKEKMTFKLLVEIMALFEMIKVYFRYQKFKNSSNLNKIFISEENNNVGSQSSKDLFQEHNDSIDSIDNPAEAKNKIKSLLSNLKNQCFKNYSYNHEYEEVLERSKKKINILSSLPIPQEMFQKNTEEENVKKQIYYGEILFLFRPLIYNFLLILKGKESFMPYISSLIIDLVRLILQRKIVFYSNIEKSEFIFRKKEILICYLLRNPFYGNILKTKIIEPILQKILGRLPFFNLLKTIILYFIEIRCSVSLLM